MSNIKYTVYTCLNVVECFNSYVLKDL